MRVVVDTGPLVALLNARDTHHAWAVRQIGRWDEPMWTCEAVITEAYFLLGRSRTGIRELGTLIESGVFEIPFQFAHHTARVHELMQRYENIPMSFADACLVCLAELHRNSRVFTLDSDFLIYRMHRARRIGTVMP